MKARTTGYAVALLMTALIAGSAVAHPTGGYGGDMGHGMMGHGMMGHGMMGPGMMGMPMMSADNLTDEQLDRIGEHMQRMHEQMESIAGARDPETRRDAVKQHLQDMQAFMHQRHDMMMHQSSRSQGQGNWRQHMEERMRSMEEMMQQQQ